VGLLSVGALEPLAGVLNPMAASMLPKCPLSSMSTEILVSVI
jgi:hypothetical protein